MSMALTFDTLQYVKHLREAEVPEKQAEAQAEALRVVLDVALSEQSRTQAQETVRTVDSLDTKTEKAIANLQRYTEKAIAQLRNDITQLRGEMTLIKWMLGILLAGVLSLVLKAFF